MMGSLINLPSSLTPLLPLLLPLLARPSPSAGGGGGGGGGGEWMLTWLNQFSVDVDLLPFLPTSIKRNTYTLVMAR